VRLAAPLAGARLWYVLLPAAAFTDIAFSGAIAPVMLGRYFDFHLSQALPRRRCHYLGKLPLIQMTVHDP